MNTHKKILLCTLLFALAACLSMMTVISAVAQSSIFQGSSVALSADSNTAIVGGTGDHCGVGAAWVYTRSGGVWTQQGAKLVGTGVDRGGVTVNFFTRNGWNMVSVPLTLYDYRKDIVFGTAISYAFAYWGGGGYFISNVLQNGFGYWLKFSSVQYIGWSACAISTDTVLVNPGWNMIGSISTPLATSSITSDPGGMITSEFFGYTGRYQTVDTIQPWIGYWVKVNQPGKLILSATPAASPSATIRIVRSPDTPPKPPEEAASTTAEVPTEFGLEQNYPNPFNPATVIRYQLSEQSHVSLKVYDILGREVTILVNEIHGAGYKSVEWNAQEMTSGLYIFKLVAGKFKDVKKMLLVR